MYIYEPMSAEDIFTMDIANMDGKSENFTADYYLSYLKNHSDSFITIRKYGGGSEEFNNESLSYRNPVIGYIFGKMEYKEHLCMHLSALSIGPSYRSIGFGRTLLLFLEQIGNNKRAYFSDLFVRASNSVAISFYKGIGYEVYRTIYDYYGDPDEDAYDMRKPLLRDKDRTTLQGGQDIRADALY
ncbi:N-terminal acetyltransferase B complex catalytic subunit [Enteropsectra breve]|nr:N-terminal acetyltransferase B complex catalytic subunit [Enteropsectra breve]